MQNSKPKSIEIRFAVGDPAGLRSTVWKIAINGSDIYIMSRMFGADAKLSVHASGECIFANTSAWVRKMPNRKNADRRIHSWSQARPNGTAAQNVFRIQIPKPEYAKAIKERTVTNLYNARQKGEVQWLEDIHRTLDAAVARAYGWDDYTPRDAG